MIGIVCSLLLCITTTNAAVTWTQITFKDGNPTGVPLRPGISCDGTFAYYIHPCRTDDCDGNFQDGGSVYQVRLADGRVTRVVESLLGSNLLTTYVSADALGNTLAIESKADLSGDTPAGSSGIPQVFIKSGDTITRLTAFDNIQSDSALKPNISCNGNVICWVSIVNDAAMPEERGTSQAYCYYRDTSMVKQITSADCNPVDLCDTSSISQNNDGTKYVVASKAPLAGPISASSPQIYFTDCPSPPNCTWQRIGLSGGGIIEPRISKDSLSILFASQPENFGLASGSETALKYSFATGIISKLFDDTPFQGTQIVAFATPDDNLSDVVVTSFAALAGTNPAQTPEQIYHGRVTQTDFIVQSGSPVNLVVTDPMGRKIEKGFSEIPEGTYMELDSDGDGDCIPSELDYPNQCNDRVTIDPRLPGDYSVAVVPDVGPTPEPGATPHTYSLVAIYNDVAHILASNAPVPAVNDPTPIYTPSVPPPEATLNLVRGYVGSASGKYRLKGSFTAPEVKGSVTLTITDGTNTKTIDLGDTANYKKVSASVISTKIINGASIIRIKFKKPAFNDWQVIIKGTKLDLAMFAGTSDSTIGYELTFGGVAYISEELFGRTGKLDLFFRVPR